MAIELPTFDRVLFKRAPLVQVICQVRFPPILEIGKEAPAEFQKRIRNDYPTLEMMDAVAVSSSGDMERASVGTLTTVWKFSDVSHNWTVSLSSAFVSLDTKDYSSFETFSEKFQKPWKAAQDCYDLSTLTRIGLRFINRLRITPGENPAKYWAGRINPALAGYLGTELMQGGVSQSQHEIRLQGDDYQLTIRHGLERKGDYRLDYDCYTDAPTRPDGTESLLARFNDILYRIFRWSLSERLFNELEPYRERTT